jgi:CRISPR-associated protein Csm3
LHIGGTETGIEIGGVDKTVIRDPLTNYPYIPGSSLKGKMRSLLEKYYGLKQNQQIDKVYIHSCGAEYKGDDVKKGKTEYDNCDLCQVFGVPGERDFATPTRLVVRDVHMTPESAVRLDQSGRTDLPYTEVKTEVSIDRVTSAANPRQMERVPAGTVFAPAELVYSIYDGDDCDPAKDVDRLETLVKGMQLLEDDYLGGLGSRGSGKVALKDIEVKLRSNSEYLEKPKELGKYASLKDLIADLKNLQKQIRATIGIQ